MSGILAQIKGRMIGVNADFAAILHIAAEAINLSRGEIANERDIFTKPFRFEDSIGLRWCQAQLLNGIERRAKIVARRYSVISMKFLADVCVKDGTQ